MILELHALRSTQEITEMQRNVCAFDNSGASHALRSTEETIKMYRNPRVLYDSGASHALRSTKEIMKTYRNPHVFNDFWSFPRSPLHRRKDGNA